MADRLNIFRFIAVTVLLVLLASMELKSQSRFKNTISGWVTDIETSKPLSDVNVFLANTTLGDVTDKDGYFMIENIPPGSYDLIFSRLGYKLEIVPVQFMTTKSVEKDIKLRPQPLKGETIQIEAAVPKEWQKNLQKFTKEFLGSTENARKCKILNPEVLDFQVDKENNRFIAATDSILIVENYSLGYRLHIILLTFRLTKDSLIYSTYPRYEELVPQDENESKRWKENRRDSYLGSFRHFLSSLARGVLEQQSFVLFSTTDKIINSDELTIKSDTSLSMKWLFLDQRLGVIYKGAPRAADGEYRHKYAGQFFPSSEVYLRSGYAQIDTLGNVYTKFAFIRSGYWHKERIADDLPFDFILDHQDKN